MKMPYPIGYAEEVSKGKVGDVRYSVLDDTSRIPVILIHQRGFCMDRMRRKYIGRL